MAIGNTKNNQNPPFVSHTFREKQYYRRPCIYFKFKLFLTDTYPITAQQNLVALNFSFKYYKNKNISLTQNKFRFSEFRN